MPKELTHWITAERTVDHVLDGPVKRAIIDLPHMYYLGAVIYDSPFYANATGKSEKYAKIADLLHGVDGGDTFAPYRAFFSHYPQKPSPEALSFISGAFTHYSLDVVFHPIVNYFSGKYFADDPNTRADSQTRHRQFEGLLDLYMYGTYYAAGQTRPLRKLGSALKNDGRFGGTVRNLSASFTSVCEIIEQFYGTTGSQAPILRMLKQHALLQRLFFNRLLSLLLYGAGKLAGGGLMVTAATFYSPLLRSKAVRAPKEELPFFAAPIFFTHPNTGEAHSGSADDFAANAVSTAAYLINGYQSALVQGEGVSYLAGVRGLSLEYGCDTLTYPEPVHYNTETSIKTLCRRICEAP